MTEPVAVIEPVLVIEPVPVIEPASMITARQLAEESRSRVWVGRRAAPTRAAEPPPSAVPAP